MQNSQNRINVKVNANMYETNQQSSLVYLLSKFDVQIQNDTDERNGPFLIGMEN